MTLPQLALALIIGLLTGFLSGQFGIGGGMITTPAIRLLLHQPAMIAVGTPLVVIIPTSVSGAIAYARNRLIDLRAGIVIGLTGSLSAVLGAYATKLVGGPFVLVVTAVVIAYMALDMALLAFRPPVLPSPGPDDPTLDALAEATAAETPAARASAPAPAIAPTRAGSLPGFIALGLVAGFFSGFLGLGGGFVVVPTLIRWFRFDAKTAIGTSLVVISILAIPGSVAHYLLGHVDLALAALLAIGVIPGSQLGARITAAADERLVKIAFSVLLLVVGVVLGASELGAL